jgi:hypothetical protein
VFGAVTLIPAFETFNVAEAEWVRAPLTAVTVIGYVPEDVAGLVAIPSMEVPVDGLGEKAVVTLLGNPLTLRVTGPVNPPVGLIDTVKLALEPWITVWVGGERLSVKSGAITTSDTAVVRTRLPLTPVIVKVLEPVGVVSDVVAASIELAVVGFGEKVAAAPLGRPAADRVTALLNPLLGLTVTL